MISGRLVQGRTSPKHRSTHIPNYQSTERESYERKKLDWRYSHVSSERFYLYKSLTRLVLCYKKDWTTLLHFIYFCYCCSLQIILSQNYLLPLISVLAESTLLKTAYHFLLLLVGFDTLTYWKDYDRSPILVGHQDSFLAPLPGSGVPLVGGIW